MEYAQDVMVKILMRLFNIFKRLEKLTTLYPRHIYLRRGFFFLRHAWRSQTNTLSAPGGYHITPPSRKHTQIYKGKLRENLHLFDDTTPNPSIIIFCNL